MKILVNEKISQHKYKTPEGYLICVDSVLARTGNQTYRKNELFADSEDDSEIEVGRSPEEVFSAETLASFENKPITIEHPDEDVNIENYKDYSVGFVRDVKQGKFDGQDVILGTLVITDKDAIEGIENGEHVELSCGYDCDIEDGDDGYQQKHIRGNHVALCEAGRAGIAKIIDSVVDEDTVKYKGYTLKFHKGYNMWLNMKDYYEVFDKQGNKVAMKKDLKSAKEYVDNGGFKDSVKDKDYGGAYDLNPESYFSRDDLMEFEDELERKLGHKARTRAYVDGTTLSVDYELDGESFSQPAEVKIDMRKIKRPRDLVKNYLEPIRKIIEKEYEESFGDSMKDAGEPRLDRAQRKMLQNYLSMISTFTSRDTDIKDILRPLSGKGFKYTIDKIEGWIWKKDEMAYKNYYISLDGYRDKFKVTLYADPEKDWKVNEVNAYFTDSIMMDASQFTTRDLDKLYQARIRSGAVTRKPESISKKVGKSTVGITFEIEYKESNNVAVPDEFIFTIWDSSRWNNGNDDKTFTYKSYKEMTSKYREVIDYANSRLSSLTNDSIVKDMDRAIFYKRRDGNEYILSIDPHKIRENGQGTIYVLEQDGLDFPNPSDGNKLLQANTMGSSDALQNYLCKKGKNCRCIDETPDEEQTKMLEKDLEHFEDADVNDTVLNWKNTYLGEETDEIRLPQGGGSIIASYDDIRNKTRIRFLGGSRGSSRDDVYVKGKPKTVEQLLKYVTYSVYDAEIPNWFESLYYEACEKYGKKDYSSQLRYISSQTSLSRTDEKTMFKWLKQLRTQNEKVKDAKEVRYQGYVIQEYHPLHDDPEGDGYIISKNGIIVGGADSIDEAIRKINRKELKRDSIKDDKLSTAKREIINWWKEVEKWNEKAGHPFNIVNDYNNAYDLWSAMYDMYTESKLKAERSDLAKQGQRIYKKWEYDFNWTFNDSINDVDPHDRIEKEFEKEHIDWDYGSVDRTGDIIGSFTFEGNHKKHIPYAEKILKKLGHKYEIDGNTIYVTDVNPRSGESKDDFIARFMKETKNEYPDEKQRLAVAYSYWERKGRDSMVKDINPDYANCLRELDKDVNQLYKLYQHGDKAPSTILSNMGYKEVGDDRFMMRSGLNKMIIEFDDFSDYIKYYVVDESGQIPRGYTVTKFKFYDSKAKDSIYSLTVQGEKSKKLVRAKDAREAINKYTRMFPKHKVSSVKKTDKFNNIIGLIKR